MLILEKIDINRGYYSKYTHSEELPALKGSVTFKGSSNTLEIELTEELSKRIIEICAEEIVKATKAAAEIMTADIINSVPAIAEDK